MPKYEYRCELGHTNELFFKIEDKLPSTVKCSECGDLAKKLFTVGGLIFRGDGFYSNDKGKNNDK